MLLVDVAGAARDRNLKDRLCEVDGDGRMLHGDSSSPWPSMRPIHRWHNDAARQEESIPSLKRSLNAKCKMQNVEISAGLHFSLCIFHSGCPFSSPGSCPAISTPRSAM